MILTRKDAYKILDVLNKFEDVNLFELEQDSSSGIGSVTTMSFSKELHGVEGAFTVEIAGVEDW